MKKLAVFFLVLISCNQDSENEKSPLSSEAIISPSGIVFAKSTSDLTKKAIAVIGRDDIVISNVQFLESKVASSVIVSLASKSGEALSNFAIARGKISYNANSLSIGGNYPGSEDRSITITCKNCANCRVQGTVEPDGTHHFQCESACCSMIVTIDEDYSEN